MTSDAPPASEVKSVLIVAMNFDASPPADLARGVPALEEAISSYLLQSGRAVLHVGRDEVLRSWHEASARLSPDGDSHLEEADFEVARSLLVSNLAAKYPADIVALPSLVVREGRFSGLNFRWDGASRHVYVKRSSHSIVEVDHIRGKGIGTSLRVALYTADGTKFFEQFAGLEVLDEYRLYDFGTMQGGRIVGKRRSDLFRDPVIIRGGVVRSLNPWLESN